MATAGGVTVSCVSSISVVSSVLVPLLCLTLRGAFATGAGAGAGFTTVSLERVVVEVVDGEGAGEIVVVSSVVLDRTCETASAETPKANTPAIRQTPSKPCMRGCLWIIL